MKACYVEKKFRGASLETIEQANAIIDEYNEQGLKLTLRQLYYQFVSRDWIPNKQSEYNKLGGIISNARLAGLIDWYAIEDRTRYIRAMSHWETPGDIIRSARYSFRVDHWQGQRYRVEVWIEKEALIGVVSGICEQLDVPYFACKGYVSQSEMWRGAERMIDHQNNDTKGTVIIHLGDHDPSGIDMTRDIQERFSLFGAYTEVVRIALNMDQVESYKPPPNPAKITDSRFAAYVSKYGKSSWELDALNPTVLRDLIDYHVTLYRDDGIYKDVLKKESEYVEILKRVERSWRTL